MTEVKVSYTRNVSSVPLVLEEPTQLDIDALPHHSQWSYRFSDGQLVSKCGGKFVVAIDTVLYCQSTVKTLTLTINSLGQQSMHAFNCVPIYTESGYVYNAFYGCVRLEAEGWVSFTIDDSQCSDQLDETELPQDLNVRFDVIAIHVN